MNHNTKVIRVILEAPKLTQHDILYCLQLSGISITTISEQCDCARETVYAVISGKRHSFDIATYIAAQLNTTTKRLWGNSYNYTPRRESRFNEVVNG